MWIRKTALVGCLAALLISSNVAQAQDKGYYGASTTLATEYIFRGAKLARTGLASDAYVGYQFLPWMSGQAYIWNWTSFAANDGNETDYDLSLTFTPPTWPVSFTPGWVYYDGQLGGDIREVYLIAQGDYIGNPTAAWYYSYLGPAVYSYFAVSGSHSWEINPRWNFDLSGTYGHFVGDIEGLAGLTFSASAPYALDENWTVSPNLDLVFPGNALGETASIRLNPSATVAYNSTF